MTAASRKLWTRVSGLSNYNRTAGQGSTQPGQDRLDRTSGTRQLGQDSQDRKAKTAELRQESQEDRRDGTARIGNRGRMARI
jgi:hypothetical protein